MKKIVKYSLAAILLMLTIAGLSAAIPILSATTPLASAQSVTGSFNPQTQFPVGSSIKITSVYGIAMVPLHPEPNGPMPPFRNQTIQHNPPSRNQTNPLHHQTNGTRPAWNRTGQHVPALESNGSAIFYSVQCVDNDKR